MAGSDADIAKKRYRAAVVFQGPGGYGMIDAFCLCLLMTATRLVRSRRKPVKSIVSPWPNDLVREDHLAVMLVDLEILPVVERLSIEHSGLDGGIK